MSAELDIPEQNGRRDKGKGRAIPTEQTPLLSESSSTPLVVEDDPLVQYRARSALAAKLTVVFVVSLFISVIIAVILWMGYSYVSRTKTIPPEELLQRAVVFRGPHHVQVLNMTGNSIWVNAQASIGIDAGAVIGVHSSDDNSMLEQLRGWVGRWGIGRLGAVSLAISPLSFYANFAKDSNFLAKVECLLPELPLTADPPRGTSWLTPITIQMHIMPTKDTNELVSFVQQSWRENAISVRVDVPRVKVRGGGRNDYSWRSNLRKTLENMSINLHFNLPPVPGLPNPDRNTPFPPVSQLVTLLDYNIKMSEPDAERLEIYARATAINPAPESFSLSTPPLPFTVHLPLDNSSELLPVASVHTHPFSFTHPNITFDISGDILPFPSDPSCTSTLSNFLTNYLSSKSSPIIITTPLLPNVTISTLFPAPDPRPRILHNVTIQNMKVKPVGSRLFASGTVFAHVVLPKGMHVDLMVNRVLPDVIVFDGEVPDDVPPPYWNGDDLPDPLPERAFGRIRPLDWLDALSVPTGPPNDGHDYGSAYAVSAKVVDVPLKVIPGREKEFSNFVGKVIFASGGTTAGVWGHAGVSVDVSALSGRDMELRGLPFQGAVHVGKGSI